MPVEVKKIAGVTRIVDSDTGKIARSVHGKPIDGGRKNAVERGPTVAYSQCRHVNEAIQVREHYGKH